MHNYAIKEHDAIQTKQQGLRAFRAQHAAYNLASNYLFEAL
jgi:hypothetical protein